MKATTISTDLERLKNALRITAELVVADPIYAPIFTRLEQEIADEEAFIAGDVLGRARALARQSATR